jgi:hypothetical protein
MRIQVSYYLGRRFLSLVAVENTPGSWYCKYLRSKGYDCAQQTYTQTYDFSLYSGASTDVKGAGSSRSFRSISVNGPHRSAEMVFD